jgi:transcriptional regulator with XRE-family HTH domain
VNTSPSQVWLVAQIEAERAARGLSVYDLADKAGIGRRTIARYLNQEREMSLAQLDAIAGALDLSFDLLVKRAQNRRDGL